jgi:hypothetical protein
VLADSLLLELLRKLDEIIKKWSSVLELAQGNWFLKKQWFKTKV